MTYDPKDQYYSPYLGFGNSPVNGVDPDGGKFFSRFEFEDGTSIVRNDGSNAVFKVTGSDQFKHFAFQGFDETLGQANEITLKAISNLIMFQNDLNVTNLSLGTNPIRLPDEQWGSETYCNFAVQNVQSALKSTGLPEYENALLRKNANNMVTSMSNYSGPYREITAFEAQLLAKQGHFVVAGQFNPTGHGHVAVLTTGADLTHFAGQIANVGASNGYFDVREIFGNKVRYFSIHRIPIRQLREAMGFGR